VKEYLLEFLQSATNEDLQEFLTFATGAPCLPDFGLGHIKIEFSDDDSIFSSTCTRKVTLPSNFTDPETCHAAIKAACANVGKAFSSV